MKKKVGNRLIALLLALFMAVTMMPDMAVGAEETDNGVVSCTFANIFLIFFLYFTFFYVG